MPDTPYPRDKKQQLWKIILSGKSRQQTLAEFNVSLATACRGTTNLPKRVYCKEAQT